MGKLLSWIDRILLPWVFGILMVVIVLAFLWDVSHGRL